MVKLSCATIKWKKRRIQQFNLVYSEFVHFRLGHYTIFTSVSSYGVKNYRSSPGKPISSYFPKFSSICDELEQILWHVVSWFPIFYPNGQELLESMFQMQEDVDQSFVGNQLWSFAKAFPYFLLLLHTLYWC